ncbi:MAG: M23 family metallopeptidase [Ruminococcus sp.]|nr:M23 family metallopeptidase [Ruminococcus sp.]
MKLYNANKRKRSTKERVGFYTALSICLAAVGMAAYSTYTNLSSDYKAADTAPTVAVNNVVTGVTETEETTASEETTESETKGSKSAAKATPFVEETAPSETKSALETMLSVETNLIYPLDNVKIIKPYNEETEYNQTLSVWEAHTGVDFACKEGDSVYAMADGEVVKVYDDDFMGKTLIVKSPTCTIYYNGLGNITVNKGDTVEQGDTIATAENVPAEYMDDNHIHIAVKAGGQYVDPLELIASEE